MHLRTLPRWRAWPTRPPGSAAAGIAGPVAFTAAWVAASLLQTGHSAAEVQISGLAAPDARDPWIMITGFVVLGGCSVAFGSALHADLGGAGRAGPGTAADPGGRGAHRGRRAAAPRPDAADRAGRRVLAQPRARRGERPDLRSRWWRSRCCWPAGSAATRAGARCAGRWSPASLATAAVLAVFLAGASPAWDGRAAADRRSPCRSPPCARWRRGCSLPAAGAARGAADRGPADPGARGAA